MEFFFVFIRALRALFFKLKQCNDTGNKKAITAGPEAEAPAVTVPNVTVTSEAPAVSCKRLLPASLFLMTFFSVMIVLIVYMDTTAMRHQQFRLKMSREYELSGVAQDAAPLVEYIKRWQLQSCASPFPPHATRSAHAPVSPSEVPPTPTETLLAQLLNYKRNGVFVEAGAYGAHGGGGSRTEWLEGALGWHGLLLTPDARDYFRLRARRTQALTQAMHACLSTSTHPKEITYQESYIAQEVRVLALGRPLEKFSARVKCFPLYSVLLAAGARNVDFLSLACGGCELPVLASLPHQQVHISIVEIVNKQTPELDALMKAKGYNLAANTPTSVIYTFHDFPTLKI